MMRCVRVQGFCQKMKAYQMNLVFLENIDASMLK